MPNVAAMIPKHITLEAECIDRMYLNAYIPRLPGQLVALLLRLEFAFPLQSFWERSAEIIGNAWSSLPPGWGSRLSSLKKASARMMGSNGIMADSRNLTGGLHRGPPGEGKYLSVAPQETWKIRSLSVQPPKRVCHPLPLLHPKQRVGTDVSKAMHLCPPMQ